MPLLIKSKKKNAEKMGVLTDLTEKFVFFPCHFFFPIYPKCCMRAQKKSDEVNLFLKMRLFRHLAPRWYFNGVELRSIIKR